MTDINELVEIIKENGGAASTEEIIKGYQKRHPMVILPEHKILLNKTLSANANFVYSDSSTNKWVIVEKNNVQDRQTVIQTAPSLWKTYEDAKSEIYPILDELFKGSNYFVSFGENPKKIDPKSLYVYKNGKTLSVLHIYPKIDMKFIGKLDLVVKKDVCYSMYGLVDMPEITILKPNSHPVYCFLKISVDDLIRYCTELSKHDFY